MKENNAVRIFVYGSLRSGFQSNAYNYVSKYFSLIGLAKTNGIMIDMGSYPIAVPSNLNNLIIGELYEIEQLNMFNYAIAQLDDYEGVNVEADEMQLFYRDITKVICNNKTSEAWVYWYKGNTDGKLIIEHGDALRYFEEKLKK